MPQRPHDTALGLARQRFVDSLGQKASELRGALALLVGSPDGARPRDDLRARLQALYASAQVFRMDTLAGALSDAAATLEAARAEGREVSQRELDELANLVATLPSLVEGAAAGLRPSMVPAPAPRSPIPQASVTPAPALSVGTPVAPSPAAPPVAARPAARPHKATMMGIPAPGVPELRAPAPPGAVSPASAPPAPRPAVGAAPARVAERPVAGREAQLVPMKPPAPFTTASSAVVGSTRSAADEHAHATSAGGYAAPAQSVVSALLCTDAASEAIVRAALPAERFEIMVAHDAAEATRLAWTSAPDLILADEAVCTGPDGLLARLRRDALSDFVPVVVLYQPGSRVDPIALREVGAVESLTKPLLAKSVTQTVHRVANLGEAAAWAPLGDLTVNDVAERIAEEIRRGLVLAADRGPDVAVPLGDGSEVLAAAWAAIARVRAHLSERSSGRVHFRDLAGRRGPALVALNDVEPSADDEAREAGGEAEVSLRGRVAIVADDDPAVRWFFAQLLEEEGARVVQVEDGVMALAAARAEPPDVILSDILMPNMDGLALCRALSRDPSVSEVPVVLLSWREDFLSRMRELRAGARGYLRKEAESAQILTKVREVLRGRAHLEARLRAGGVVRGRVEGLGVPCLLATVRREREHALLTVRDAFNLFEVEIRDHSIVSVSSTATDGSFSRGDRALRMLVGVSTGRFAVDDVDTEVRHSMAGGAPQLSVRDACARLGAMIDAVSGESLARVASLGLDDDALDSFGATAPGEVGAVAAALASGQSPRQLLVGGVHAPQAVEAALIELARRGVILGVRGDDGEDLVDETLRERVAPEGALPAERISDNGVRYSVELDSGEQALSVSLGAPKASRDLAPPLSAQLVEALPLPQVPALAAGRPEPAISLLPPDLSDMDVPALVPVPAADPVARGVAAVDTDPDEDHEDLEDEAEEELPPRESFGPLTWFAVLFMLAAIGYVGYAMMLESQRRRGAEAGAEPVSAVDPAESHETAPTDATQAEDEDATAAAAGAPVDPDVTSEEGLSFGMLRPGARLETGAVPAGHGVLFVQVGSRDDVTVFVGERELGPPPQHVALPEGRHAVRFRVGPDTIHRYYFIRRDHTRVVPVPES